MSLIANNSKLKYFFLSFWIFFFFIFILLSAYQLSLSTADLDPGQREVLAFLSDHNFQYLSSQFTDNEISHLEDVYKVMFWLKILSYLALSLVVIIALIFIFFRFSSNNTSFKHIKNKLPKYLLAGGLFTSVFVIILAFLSYFFFDSTFVLFHQIFFPQGNWQFPTGSLLIEIFPEQFFFDMAVKIFLIALVFGIIFIFLGVYLNYVLKNQRS